MAEHRDVSDLRPLRDDDIEALSSWLPAVAAAAGCGSLADAAALRHAVEGGGALVGAASAGIEAILLYETEAPLPRAARVRFLAVDPVRCRLGIGGRAAVAREDRVRRAAGHVYVSVPAELGLALYFWLRLGYRPLTQAACPARPERRPSTWLARELGSQRSR